MIFNFIFVKCGYACRSIVCGYILLCFFVPINCSAKGMPLINGNVWFYESPSTSIGMKSILPERNVFVDIDKELHRKIVELLSFVSADIEPIADKESKEENENVDYYSKREIHYLILLSITGVLFVLILPLLIEAVYYSVLWFINLILFIIKAFFGQI